MTNLAEARTWAGYRSAHFNQQTGTLIVIVDAWVAGLETEAPGEPRWATICDAHDSLVLHYTLADARNHAAAPAGWCEPCRELLDHQEGTQ